MIMETTIKKFVELAKEISVFCKDIQKEGWTNHTDLVAVYYANGYKTISVEFGTEYENKIEVALYNNTTRLNFLKSQDYYEGLYEECLKSFTEYKDSNFEDLAIKIKKEKLEEIAELKEKLKRLENETTI